VLLFDVVICHGLSVYLLDAAGWRTRLLQAAGESVSVNSHVPPSLQGVATWQIYQHYFGALAVCFESCNGSGHRNKRRQPEKDEIKTRNIAIANKSRISFM